MTGSNYHHLKVKQVNTEMSTYNCNIVNLIQISMVECLLFTRIIPILVKSDKRIIKNNFETVLEAVSLRDIRSNLSGFAYKSKYSSRSYSHFTTTEIPTIEHCNNQNVGDE